MLASIVRKPARILVGLMSGTSVDGIDAAAIAVEGPADAPSVQLLAFENQPFPETVREQIFTLFDPRQATVDRVGYLNFLLGELYAAATLSVIEKAGLTPSQVDLIGSHGQTIYHHPELCGKDGFSIRYTVQIGEGAVIADRTGIPCFSDFRVADMAAGGQGAPLVPFTEFLLYRRPDKNILLQNIGGVGNITVLPMGCRMEDIFAFDTGPGNLLIDGMMSKLFGMPMDQGGTMAAKGSVHAGLLDELTQDPYYTRPLPKTTGRELYSAQYVDKIIACLNRYSISKQDGMATVTYLTAWSIADAYQRYILPRCQAHELIIGGGGSYNPTLVHMIREAMSPFGIRVQTQEETGQNSDAKEAVAFALLADCAAAGMCNNLPSVTGARHPVVMGKLSFPSI